MRTKSTGGFTLIELLIVIAIIGILAAVLIPNLMNARTQAQMRALQSWRGQIYTVGNAMLAQEPNLTLANLVTALTAECDGTAFESIDAEVNGADVTFNYGVNAAPAIFDGCTVAPNATNTDFTVTLTNTVDSLESVNGQGWTTP